VEISTKFSYESSRSRQDIITVRKRTPKASRPGVLCTGKIGQISISISQDISIKLSTQFNFKLNGSNCGAEPVGSGRAYTPVSGIAIIYAG
jgi:hypothetical protein